MPAMLGSSQHQLPQQHGADAAPLSFLCRAFTSLQSVWALASFSLPILNKAAQHQPHTASAG